MNYKTILVHLDGARGLDARIALATQLALTHDAHLVGVSQTGILRFLYGLPPEGYLGDLTPLFQDLKAAADRRADRFEAAVRQAGVASFERRVGDEEAGYVLACQSMYADLVILGQSDPDDPDSAHAGIPEYVALHAPCPVLVLPCNGRIRPAIERVVVGWNASPEAARAVRQALPFLMRASEVEIAVFGEHEADQGSLGGMEVALMLARHGVNATLRQESAGGDAAAALLARVDDGRADLLVMGCYGHSRLRETLLGGASRTVLRGMTVPTLMAH